MKHAYIKISLLLAVAILASCGNRGEKTASKGPVSVKVFQVTASENASARTYIGTVHPEKSTVISAKVPGTLATLCVRQGQKVKAGDVLAVVESERIQSSLEAAKATLDQARDGYNRAKAVHEAGTIADVKMVEIQTKLTQAEAAYNVAKKAAEDCSLKAPYDGVVGEVYADEGVELALAEAVVKIMDVSSVEVHFSVPEGEISKICVGEKVYLKIPALENREVQAKISTKGFSASVLSHCYECSARPVAAVEGLLPGMVCKVSLSEGVSDAFVLPISVVRTDMDSRYVWLVREGRVVKQNVKVGGFSGSGIIITSGLEEGDEVITDGVRSVSSGMQVQVVE